MKSPSDDYDPFDDERTREYYDRKVARAEEVLPFIGWMCAIGLIVWVAVIVYQALDRLV